MSKMNISNRPTGHWLALLFIATIGFSLAPCVDAQDEFKSQFSDLIGGMDDGIPEYQFTGNFTVDKGKRSGTLNVILDIKQDWHGYSQKQLSGQSPTKIEVADSDEFTITGPFTPDQQPKPKTIEIGDVEEFTGRVTWSAPIEFAEGVDFENTAVNIRVRGQVCKTMCVQFNGDNARLSARFKEYTHSVEAYVSDYGSISGKLDQASITPGDTANLTITAKMIPNWHIYKFEPFKKEGTTPQPTIVYFSKTSGLHIGTPTASKEPIQHEIGLPGEKFTYYHEGEVTWTIPISVPTEIEHGNYPLEGRIVFQLCTDSNCDRPTALNFRFPVEVANVSNDETVGLALSVINDDPDDLMLQSREFWDNQKTAGPAAAIAPLDLAFYLVLAFFAGLILNAMPCVLPVIGLKVMSFIQQAGENRGRIFFLNLVFSLGLLSVFWVLATLSAFFGFGWGDWLTKSFTGSIIITSVVFAFGLSMLGVWELPIPGLSGSSGISKQAEEEGLLGAFLLGILTTILATPCTGPMLVPAVTVTAGQPPWVAYLIFTTIGLGMAMPYLMVGIFPSLIGWLPRPGAWMNTFKQVTGFILMATVVFLMSSFSSEPRSEYLVAMMTLLLCIAIGCWWIGRTSLAAETSDQLRAWGTGISIVAVGAFLAFSYLGPSMYELDWQDYSRARLVELNEDRKLVFIDFTGPG